MSKNFSANSLRPFRDRDVVWFTPLLPFLAGGFVYLMVIFAHYLDNLLSLPVGFLPHPIARKAVGSVIAVVGLSFFTLGLGRSLLFISKVRGRKFMTTGVFKYTRNPSAFGIMAALFGVSFIINSLSMLFIALAMLIFFTITVNLTDSMMLETYGDLFAKYRDTTPRFIPNFNRLIRNILGLE